MYVPAIGLLAAVPCMLLTAYSGLLVVAIVGLVLYRLFGCFAESNMMPILCEIVDKRYRATGYGLLNMTGTIAAGLGIYAAGALKDWGVGLSQVFTAVAFILVLCPLLLVLMRPRNSAASP
jgi:MFS family permease